MTEVAAVDGPARAVRFFAGGPERLLHVGDVGGDALAALGAMQTGAWVLGPDGAPAPGSLGVLIDDVWGGAAVTCAPDGLWGVSTEMTVSFGAPPAADGTRLSARGQTVYADQATGLATGTVRGADGALVAIGTQRTRFAPGAPRERPLAPGMATDRGIAELLALVAGDDDVLALEVIPALSNPAGVLHGGIQFCAAELAASRAIGAARAGLVPSSLTVSYLRAGPMGETVRLVTDVVYRGRTMAAVDVRCLREDGKACSAATVTYGPVATSNR